MYERATEGDERMKPSCIEPAVQAGGGSNMTWGYCSWSGQSSATLWPKG